MKFSRETVGMAALVVLVAGALSSCSGGGGMGFQGRPSADQPDMNYLYYQVNEDMWKRSKLGEAPVLILSNKRMGTSIELTNLHKVTDASTLKEGQWILYLSHELPTSTTVHFCKIHPGNLGVAPNLKEEKPEWGSICFLDQPKDIEDWQRNNNFLRVPGAK